MSGISARQNHIPYRYRVFGLSLKALALARFVAGMVVLWDLYVRWLWRGEFLSGEGFCPRSAILAAGRNFLVPWPHLANDTLEYQSLLLLVQAVFALMLAVGYQTRMASVVTWVGMTSLNARNTLILNSGDTLLTAVLFWGMFLPWGRCWAVDSRSRPAVDGKVFSAATIGLCLQVASVYAFAALHKLNPVWLSEGRALLYALSLEHHALPSARGLLELGALLKPLGWAVLGVEAMLPLVLLAPWPRVRALAVVSALSMHWTFGLFLELGTIRWTPWVGLVALLPMGKGEDGAVEDRLSANLLSCGLLSVALLAFAVNLEGLGKGTRVFLPSFLVRYSSLVSANQMWGVFEGKNLQENGWFAFEIKGQDGQSYDYWTGQSFSRQKPTSIASQYPTDRWRKFLMNLPSLPPGHPQRLRFARWILQDWNRQNPDRLAFALTFWQVSTPTRLSGHPSHPVWHVMEDVRL